jgi:uncharacterized protein (TIGR02145 family)
MTADIPLTEKVATTPASALCYCRKELFMKTCERIWVAIAVSAVIALSVCSKKPERETAPVTTDTLSVTTDTLSLTTDTLPTAPSDTFTDKRDGQKYRIVTIGHQMWMAENLNYKTDSSWCYDNRKSNCKKYGKLYNWNAAMWACPPGWYLPSRREWTDLATQDGGTVSSRSAGKKLKSASGWNRSGNGTDEYGFSALPGGGRNAEGRFDGVGCYGYWWTSTEDSVDGYAYSRYMDFVSDYVGEGSQYDYYNGKSDAFSIRCTMMAAYESSGRIRAVYEPIGYRVDNYNEIPDTNRFIGLFREKNGYYLKPANVSFVKGKDDCTYGLNLALKSDAEFLFLNFTGYNEDKIPSVKLDRDKTMLPNNNFAFDFGDKRYELKAFGERCKTDEDYEDCVKNYSLVFSEKGTDGKQTIVRIPRTEHSAPQLLFIGDLDGDGKPDIILNAQSHYENRYIMVFLSSTAKKGEILRLEAKKFNWFDC